MIEWYKYNRRQLFLQRRRMRKPPFVWPINVEAPDLAFLKHSEFYAASRMMRRRLKDDVYRLDIERTI